MPTHKGLSDVNFPGWPRETRATFAVNALFVAFPVVGESVLERFKLLAALLFDGRSERPKLVIKLCGAKS